MINKNILERYGYKLVERIKFEEEAAKNPNHHGLLHRASKFLGPWVIYDPSDDDEGYLIVGYDPEKMASEAVADLELAEWMEAGN